jgi:hypothetical protein
MSSKKIEDMISQEFDNAKSKIDSERHVHGKASMETMKNYLDCAESYKQIAKTTDEALKINDDSILIGKIYYGNIMEDVQTRMDKAPSQNKVLYDEYIDAADAYLRWHIRDDSPETNKTRSQIQAQLWGIHGKHASLMTNIDNMNEPQKPDCLDYLLSAKASENILKVLQISADDAEMNRIGQLRLEVGMSAINFKKKYNTLQQSKKNEEQKQTSEVIPERTLSRPSSIRFLPNSITKYFSR